ncbi:hypothetical protein SAMN02982989_3426 [Xaviernesmea oryzae]|uniref:Fibronectin type-III domain-containing protein n=1 Tax=Xaviernesmea oryzae TaxID=464029 RepID=A0A1X7G8P9_9HYPH|nr:hypothetical protein [Xaviernesmea oryzae]SMF65979.1 hypothetical protein SAMN02982989_3426 [Xaviernesmea oryzae]
MTGLEIIPIIVSSLATTVAAANALYLATWAAIAGVIGYSVYTSLNVQKPAVPKPEDGSYNLKQPVPSLAYVLGRVKKGADYVFLEETGGTAYHIMVWAAHRINRFTQHYLHDKKVTLDGTAVITPPFFYNGTANVRLDTRLGLNASTAYAAVTAAFPTIWTNAHRGDGLASVLMRCRTVSQKNFLTIYPNQMPEHSAVGEGALLYDPRKDSTQGGSGSHRFTDPNTWEFSTNLALMRLWHLCHPVGGKMPYTAMHLPDWAHAADVCDQNVTNRTGGTEKRYHGGFWFRANNDPVEVGRIMDEAAELVVYERADGKIGVHAGEYVAPDIRITAANAYSIRVDKNKRRANTVLAVRGRWVNPANDYNTEDAAIFGDPYGIVDDSTERTKTFDNQAIQSHNHCQRKQKLTFIRANARKVAIVADYTAENLRNIPYRRFVTVHYPRRGLVNAVIEITSSVTIDLRNMRLSFSGIVVSSSLYAFDAATEEGEPGEVALPAPSTGVPVPQNFAASVQTEVVSGGATAAFILGTWDFVDDTLLYELEYERTSGGTGPQSTFSEEGESQVRTGYLVDGEQYRVRLRAWGGGTSSEWTGYILLTATADPVPPGPVTAVSVDVSTPGQAVFQWTAPNSANYFACRIFINTVDDLATATLAATEYGPPSAEDLRTVTSLTPGNYYAWLSAINPSGKPSDPADNAVPTGLFIIS